MTRLFASLKAWFNPLDARGGFVIPHIILIGAIAGAFAIGVGVGRTTSYDAAYFRAHFPNRVLTMHDPHVVGVVPARPATFAPAASIHLSVYPAVGNQGTLGSCAGYATSWALSYEWRITHPGSWLRFNAICMYSYYSCTYNACQNGGSWPTQDAEFIPARGIAKFKQVPELSPQAILAPVPGACFNTTYRAPVSFTQIGYGDNEGQGAIDGIKAAVSAGYPVLVALPVYPEYDNAANTGGLVDIPQPGEVSRGGHENVILAYDDSKFGGRGGVLVQNQWTTLWSVGGRAWLSYDFVRTYVFSLLVPHMSTMVPHASKPPTFVPNHAPKHLITAPVALPPEPPALTGKPWYVRNVVLRDTGQNISGLLNYWGDRYGIAPYGLAAVAATESGWRQIADRYGVWPDVSFGLMQFTVSTATGYGVCRDTQSCRTWLDVPSNAIYLAARYLSEARAAACVDWPWLYIAYNAGSSIGCGAYFYTHPTGQAYTNFYGNFLPNLNVVLAHYLGPPPAPPKPRIFPLKAWQSYTTAHHRPAISARWHGHRSWEAYIWWSHRTHCGGVVTHSQWHPRGRQGLSGYMAQRFQKCSVVLWPRHPKWHPKVTAAPYLR